MSNLIISTSQNQDLDGLIQLSRDGIVGLADLVEAVHQRIYTLGGLLKQNDDNRTNGITGFVYRAIRNTTRLSVLGINFALQRYHKPSNHDNSNLSRHWIAILNGILGDHLDMTNNPLAIEMTMTYHGQAITVEQAIGICQSQHGNPLLLIHGLCMNDQKWRHKGHDHGYELQQSLDVIPIHIRYNSGLAVQKNGHQLAAILNQFLGALPTNQHCHVLCHSMGGLVYRSAMQMASTQASGQPPWTEKIAKVVFLGTPHNGAILEKSGHLLDYLISVSPYSAPFVKLTGIRSQGIKDLRLGRTNQNHESNELPAHVKTYAIAASTQQGSQQLHQHVVGDGLVSVASALGQENSTDKLDIPAAHQFIVKNVNHMGLLSDPKVSKHLKQIYSQ